MSKLQSIQNFEARIVTRTRTYDHVTPVLKELKCLPEDAVMAFKCPTSRVPEYLSSRFIKRAREEIIGRIRRTSHVTLNITLFKSASGQKDSFIVEQLVFGTLDCYLKTFKSVSDFKFNMKCELVKKFIDSYD